VCGLSIIEVVKKMRFLSVALALLCVGISSMNGVSASYWNVFGNQLNTIGSGCMIASDTLTSLSVRCLNVTGELKLHYPDCPSHDFQVNWQGKYLDVGYAIQCVKAYAVPPPTTWNVPTECKSTCTTNYADIISCTDCGAKAVTSMTSAQCASRTVNVVKGRLQCTTINYWSGNYQNQCKLCDINNGVLYCNCKNSAGTAVGYSSLTYPSCATRRANVDSNGMLICDTSIPAVTRWNVNTITSQVNYCDADDLSTVNCVAKKAITTDEKPTILTTSTCATQKVRYNTITQDIECDA